MTHCNNVWLSRETLEYLNGRKPVNSTLVFLLWYFVTENSTPADFQTEHIVILKH